MTPYEWRQIDPKDRGTVWSFLTEADRAAILASEKQSEQSSVPQSESRVVIAQSEVIHRLRAKTAYGAARSTALIFAIAGWVAGLAYFGIGVAHLSSPAAGNEPAWFSFALGIASVLAGMLTHYVVQAVADLADCAMQREVRALEEKNNK